MVGIVLGAPDNRDTRREFVDGSTRSYTRLGSASVGLGVYQPGWRWSLHAGPQTGKPAANHIGYVITGAMRVQDAEGREREIGAGFAFEVGPGHDAWVVGTEPCTALDFTPVVTDSTEA